MSQQIDRSAEQNNGNRCAIKWLYVDDITRQREKLVWDERLRANTLCILEMNEGHIKYLQVKFIFYYLQSQRCFVVRK